MTTGYLFTDIQKQPSLPLQPVQRPSFAGSDYVPARDEARLSGQLADIFSLMKDGQWRTLDRIHRATGHPPASISAQLRHLRASRHGAHTVNKRHDGGGLFSYQLVVNQ